MNFTETEIKGCFIIEPTVYTDERGYFFESFREDQFQMQTGIPIHFVQSNQSKSNYGVVRGLHMQLGEHSQSKLVRVLSGKILDIAVDIRIGSPTFGQHIAVELNSENYKQLFIPKGFLHGYSVLSEDAIVLYQCDTYYHKASDTGVYPLDSELNIDWKVPPEEMILSEKDSNASLFSKFVSQQL